MRETLFFLLILFAAALPAVAQEPTEEEVRAVNGIVGETFKKLPGWRQRMMIRRYREFQGLDTEKRKRIEQAGLRDWLLAKPERRMDLRKLPDALRDAVRNLPPAARRLAAKLVVMRWRQLELDGALRRIPEIDERRRVFQELFPEPFDAKAAHVASKSLKKRLVKTYTADFQAKLDEMPGSDSWSKEERKRRAGQLLRARMKKQHELNIARIGKELQLNFQRAPNAQEARRRLQRQGFDLLERGEMNASPRERELLRYALRPMDCPFLDLRFMGPPPRDRMERRRWDRDYHVLARLELFSEMNLPMEMVLHLASCGSRADLIRAFRSIRGGHPRVGGRSWGGRAERRSRGAERRDGKSDPIRDR